MIEHRTDGSDTLEANREYHLRQLGKEIDRLMRLHYKMWDRTNEIMRRQAEMFRCE